MAHARRKFLELHAANQSPVAAEALRRIAEILAIEGRARTLDAAARQLLREQQALPKLQALHDWLHLTGQGVANGSSLAKAIGLQPETWTALHALPGPQRGCWAPFGAQGRHW
ncbi:transposase [Pseudomonas stutzeri]|nr:transposase [Stutzerimonas stutzeri]